MSFNPAEMPLLIAAAVEECLLAAASTAPPLTAIATIDKNAASDSLTDRLAKLGQQPHVRLFLRLEQPVDDDGVFPADLLSLKPAGIVLPDCAGRADVQKLAAALRVAEAKNDLADGSTAIIAEVGADPAFFLSPHPLANGSTRLCGLVLDQDDAGSGAVAAYARAIAVLKARQAGIPCHLFMPADIPPSTSISDFRHAALGDGFAGIVARSAVQLAALLAI